MREKLTEETERVPTTGTTTAEGPESPSTQRNGVDVGGAALVAGTMVGAGVLALPAVSAPAGFVPASVALVLTWAYMVGSAMLGAEVAVHASCALGRPNGVSLLSQARLTLGPVGAAVSSASYVFLHYAVLVAYVSQGSLVIDRLVPALPDGGAGALFLGALAFALYAFNDEQVDTMNTILFAGVVISFTAVMAALVPLGDAGSLVAVTRWSAVPRAVPTLLLSCVYHNIVGTIAVRSNGDIGRVRETVVLGSGVPLVMFIAANAVVLAATGNAGSTTNPLADLSQQGGVPAAAIEAFAFLAVATSAIGFVEGLNQLWNDARVSILGETPDAVSANPLPSYALSVVPPVALAAVLADSFLGAIDLGGLYGVSVLFGVLPAAMVWRQRYSKDAGLATLVRPAVPGGRVGLAIMIALPSFLILYNTAQLLGM